MTVRELVARATDPRQLAEPDVALNLQVVERLNQSSAGLVAEVVMEMQRGLKSKDGRKVQLSLMLIDVCLRNGTNSVQSMLASRNFMSTYLNMVNNLRFKWTSHRAEADTQAYNLALHLIRTWATVFAPRSDTLAATFLNVYRHLRTQPDIDFPPEDLPSLQAVYQSHDLGGGQPYTGNPGPRGPAPAQSGGGAYGQTYSGGSMGAAPSGQHQQASLRQLFDFLPEDLPEEQAQQQRPRRSNPGGYVYRGRFANPDARGGSGAGAAGDGGGYASGAAAHQWAQQQFMEEPVAAPRPEAPRPEAPQPESAGERAAGAPGTGAGGGAEAFPMGASDLEFDGVKVMESLKKVRESVALLLEMLTAHEHTDVEREIVHDLAAACMESRRFLARTVDWLTGLSPSAGPAAGRPDPASAVAAVLELSEAVSLALQAYETHIDSISDAPDPRGPVSPPPGPSSPQPAAWPPPGEDLSPGPGPSPRSASSAYSSPSAAGEGEGGWRAGGGPASPQFYTPTRAAGAAHSGFGAPDPPAAALSALSLASHAPPQGAGHFPEAVKPAGKEGDPPPLVKDAMADAQAQYGASSQYVQQAREQIRQQFGLGAGEAADGEAASEYAELAQEQIRQQFGLGPGASPAPAPAPYEPFDFLGRGDHGHGDVGGDAQPSGRAPMGEPAVTSPSSAGGSPGAASAESMHGLVARHIERVGIQELHAMAAGKHVLVLDVDGTLADFRGCEGDPRVDPATSSGWMRPHLQPFLEAVFPFYHLVLWSQSSWHNLELKLATMDVMQSDRFQVSFVLSRDHCLALPHAPRGSALASLSAEPRGVLVKPLSLIWSHFPDLAGPHNTVHIDDAARNFLLNPANGIQVAPYHAPTPGLPDPPEMGSRDTELFFLQEYLIQLADSRVDVSTVQHDNWRQDIVISMHERNLVPRN